MTDRFYLGGIRGQFHMLCYFSIITDSLLALNQSEGKILFKRWVSFAIISKKYINGRLETIFIKWSRSVKIKQDNSTIFYVQKKIV